MSNRLILASRSPRRQELLREYGYVFDVVVPDESAEDGLCSGESPVQMVARLAFQKAKNVATRLFPDFRCEFSFGCQSGCVSPVEMKAASLQTQPSAANVPPSAIILGCDTIAELQGMVLGKPQDEDHARQMLQSLSGRRHRVISGVCLLPIPGGRPIVQTAITTLRMDDLSANQLDEYIASGQWDGKAGAFGYQDRLGWIHIIEGSESNVVGLPMELLGEMLAGSRTE